VHGTAHWELFLGKQPKHFYMRSYKNSYWTYKRQNSEIGQKWMPKSAKAFGFRGASPSDPLTRGSAPGPRWGHRPQIPVIGSRYRAPHVSHPSHFSLRSDAYELVWLACLARAALLHLLTNPTAYQINSTVPITQIPGPSRPLLGRAYMRIVPNRVCWCMVE